MELQMSKNQSKNDNLIKINNDLKEINLFKKSLYFKTLEQTSLIGEDLQFKESTSKYDLDSDEG